jgi:hypothetical protein
MTASMSAAAATSANGVKYPCAKFWQETNANVTDLTIEFPGGVVRVRPVRLISSPALKR